ncbi:MAG TPA: hypothetical protein VM370_07005 [Candidatus Thermoplasmatota archaeon]|nr:hypothetical protein [Candidatus Thermoplasmatota archaeon]
MKLTSAGRTALWIGCGGFVGLAVGAMLTNPGRAFSLSPLWLVALAVFVGLVIGLTRVKDPDAKSAKEAKSAKHAAAPRAMPQAPLSPDALHVRFELPDVPPGYPPVLGRGEPLQVKVRVSLAGPAAPAEGAAVQLSAAMDGGSLQGDGITGTGGEVEFTLEPEGTGELALSAEAKAGASAGRGAMVVSIVNYEEEIERLFGEFRAYAAGVLGPEAHADTARELCDKLRHRADPQTARALLELARVYELVAYGERTADRRLYLAVLEQLMMLEHAELPAPGRVTREA